MGGIFLRVFVLCALACASLLPSVAAAPAGEGTQAFVARPKFGAAVFNLPSRISWRTVVDGGGLYHVVLTADIDVQPVLSDVKALSAKAIDRDIPCGDVVKVRTAAAKLTGPRSVKYDVHFHLGKRICAAGMPLELPAEVFCSSNVSVTAAASVINVDVRGATAPPCQIAGDAAGISQMFGAKIFKRHAVDLAKVLPKEFQGVAVNVRTLAIDQPPARATLHIAGESTMSAAQFAAFITRIEAAARPAR
jgi:hypothetical protein